MQNFNLISLVESLKFKGVLKTPAIINAFLSIDRLDFVPENEKSLVYIDEALPIGKGQTISQPYTVAFMLELLQPEAGDKILDIGYGSGWQTALLASIVKGEKREGKVYAVEIIPELCDFGKRNIAKYNFIKSGIVETFCKNASEGLLEVAEKIGGFDRIIAAAALKDEIAEPWEKQLKINGRMVAPIGNSIWLFIKKNDNEFETKEFQGFVFVPFVNGKKSLISYD